MEADLCSILKGEAGTAGNIGWDTRATAAKDGGTGNGYTYVSVDIVVCLGGLALPICC